MPTERTIDVLLEGQRVSQVWFVLNYVQLQFDDVLTLTILPVEGMKIGDPPISHGERGFCDAIVALIGRHVVETHWIKDESCTLVFNDSTPLVISIREPVSANPEALHLIGQSKEGSVFWIYRYGDEN